MTTLNVTELALKLDTDPRTARKFLRSITPITDQPGKGSRWSIEAKQVQSLKSKFTKFTAAQATARAERDMHRESPVDAPEVDEFADTDAEPTDDDLAEIDAE